MLRAIIASGTGTQAGSGRDSDLHARPKITCAEFDCQVFFFGSSARVRGDVFTGTGPES